MHSMRRLLLAMMAVSALGMGACADDHSEFKARTCAEAEEQRKDYEGEFSTFLFKESAKTGEKIDAGRVSPEALLVYSKVAKTILANEQCFPKADVKLAEKDLEKAEDAQAE